MHEQQKGVKYLRCAAKGAVVTLVAGTVILLILSAVIGSGKIPSSLMEEYVIATVILATFIGGLVSVRLQGRTAAITALLSGMLILIGITVASMLANGIIFFNSLYVKMLISIFAGSITGGILGTRRTASKKRKKAFT